MATLQGVAKDQLLTSRLVKLQLVSDASTATRVTAGNGEENLCLSSARPTRRCSDSFGSSARCKGSVPISATSPGRFYQANKHHP